MVKGAEEVIKGTKPFWSTIGKGALEGAKVGAIQGGLVGGGRPLQENKSLGEAAVGAGIGTLGGGLIGAGLGAGTAGLGAGLSRLLATPESKATFVVEKAKNLYNKAIDVSAPKVRDFQENIGKSLGEFLAEEQIPLRSINNAKAQVLDTIEARKIAGQRVAEMAAQKEPILAIRPQSDIDLGKIANEAAAELKKTIRNQTELKNRLADIEELIGNEIETYGGLVDGSTADRIKSGMWSIGYDMGKPTRNKTARVLGNKLKVALEKAYKGVEGEDILKSINKKEGEYLSAITALGQKGGAHGKVIRGGLLGRSLNQISGVIAGGTVGSVGGPLSGVLGSLAGGAASGRLNDFLLDPERLTMKAMKMLQKNGEIPEYLRTLEDAKQFLEYARSQPAPLQLGPGAMRMPAAGERGYSGFIKAPAPTQLPYEIRPGQRALPTGRTPGEIPILMGQGTTYEPSARIIGGKGQVIEGEVVPK